LTSECSIPSETVYFGRGIELNVVLYLGDTVTFDCTDFGLSPSDGFWNYGYDEECIDVVPKADGTVSVTAKALSTESDTTQPFIWFEPTEEFYKNYPYYTFWITFTIYKNNPHTTKANFRVETAQYEPIYYCGPADKSNLSSIACRYWAYPKGTIFNRDTAYTNLSYISHVIDYLHIYPDSSFPVDTSDLEGDGYIKINKIDKYFTIEDVTHADYIHTESIDYGSGIITALRAMTDASQNVVTTVKITSNIDGRSVYFDFETRYADWDY
jgi:hypothetical protein